MKKILLLGSGELGKEFTISAKRLGLTVIAVDRYAKAPAMQVADAFEVIDMLDGEALKELAKKHQPDFIVPEIEAIRTSALKELEAMGMVVVPTARAAHLTMNRDAIRELAANELGLRTAKYSYANNLEELRAAAHRIGFPNVIKPVMSSSGKGQSVAKKTDDLENSWQMAIQNMRGDTQRVIVEELINFELEITLLTIKQRRGPTLFVAPIGHRQERGDYQESWQPAALSLQKLKMAQKMAKKITDNLGGAGLFGVEFFVTKKEVIFSELSPRPHDTGMVTLISQDLSEFDLHLRAILGLPIAKVGYFGPSASAVILAEGELKNPKYLGLESALKIKGVDLRIFGKPTAKQFRRMGVALARASSVKKARQLAKQAAKRIKVR